MRLEDKSALYYPYIHIRDTNWLKATLLCFPDVRRMVPPNLALHDNPEVKRFRELKGAHGKPLVSEEDTSQYAVYEAQERVKIKLEDKIDYLRENYGRSQTESAVASSDRDFIVHKGKMQSLLDFLTRHDLAWLAPEQEYHEWYCMHPRVGEAVMSTVALGIAREKGLDVVTNKDEAHLVTQSCTEEKIVDALLQPEIEARNFDEVNESELSQFFMTTALDVTRMTPEQIAELAKEGKDLRRFREAVSKLAERIPKIPHQGERKSRLEEASAEIISEWNDYKSSLPKFAVDAILDASKIKAPEIVTAALAGTTVAQISLGTGLLIGFLLFSGIRVWRTYRGRSASPFSYLSKIMDSGAVLIT